MEEEKTASEAPVAEEGKKKTTTTGGGQPSAAEETASPYPDMELCQNIHRMTVKSSGVDTDFNVKIFTQVGSELENPSLYKHMTTTLGLPGGTLSDADLKVMDAKHLKHMEELEAKVEEAKESAGDMEVMDARVEIARFAAKSLDEDQTLEAYQKLLDLPKISSGKKIDALMESSRVASFYGDDTKSADFIESVSFWLILIFIILHVIASLVNCINLVFLAGTK